MKRLLLNIAAGCAGTILLVLSAFAAKDKPAETNLSSEQIEANYTKAIENRTADILKALAFGDTNRASRVMISSLRNIARSTRGTTQMTRNSKRRGRTQTPSRQSALR